MVEMWALKLHKVVQVMVLIDVGQKVCIEGLQRGAYDDAFYGVGIKIMHRDRGLGNVLVKRSALKQYKGAYIMNPYF